MTDSLTFRGTPDLVRSHAQAAVHAAVLPGGSCRIPGPGIRQDPPGRTAACTAACAWLRTRSGVPLKVSESVIRVSELTRRFGATTALASVSLDLPRGAVYGLVGANGAGKTTLIKHLLGLLRAERGSVRVFGLDPVADPVAVLSRIGYLSEEDDLPGWMRVEELMRYTRAFYPAWDDGYAEELRQKFALDPAAKIKTLSRGQKARAGLLIALAYRPELLVLDEPSSGLDPIVRRDILGAVMRTIAHEGRTVLFSSHLLEEVERVADHVTMIHQGKVVLSAPLAEIRDSHRLGQRVPSLDELFVAHVGMPAAPASEA